MEGWGVKIVTKLSSFGKEEYPQGEVVGKIINTYESQE